MKIYLKFGKEPPSLIATPFAHRVWLKLANGNKIEIQEKVTGELHIEAVGWRNQGNTLSVNRTPRRLVVRVEEP